MGEQAVAIDGPEIEEKGDGLVETTTPEPETAETVDDAEAPQESAEKTELTEKEKKEAENAEIRERAFRLREAKREAAEERQLREELQRRLNQYETPVRPDIPPPPDPYDDDYQQKIQQRDALIARAAQFDAQQQLQYQYQQQLAQQQEVERTKALTQAGDTYVSRAEKLGIDLQELNNAARMAAQLLPQRTRERLLYDDQGPAVTAYLGRNMVEMDKIANMQPEDAAIYIENVIKPKARPKPPRLTPNPSEKLSGAGMREGERGPPGTVYE